MKHLWIAGVVFLAAFVMGLFAYRLRNTPPIVLSQTDGADVTYREGAEVTLRVVAVNSRPSAFHVESVSTSCGCAKPMIGKKALAQGALLLPNSETSLDVVINTARTAGILEHSLRITGFYDDPSKVFAAVTKLKIVVAARTKIVPSEVLLLDTKAREPTYAEILILDGGSGDASRVSLREVSSPDRMSGEFLGPEGDYENSSGQRGYVVQRRFRLKYTPRDDHSVCTDYVDFVVPTEDGDENFRVSVMCRMQSPPISFSPPSLVIDKTEGGDVRREILCLTNAALNNDVSVVTKPVDVDARIKVLKPGRYLLYLTIPAKRVSDGAGFEIQIGPNSRDSKAAVYRVAVTGSQQ